MRHKHYYVLTTPHSDENNKIATGPWTNSRIYTRSLVALMSLGSVLNTRGYRRGQLLSDSIIQTS